MGTKIICSIVLVLMLTLSSVALADVTDTFVSAGGNVTIATEGASSVGLINSGMSTFGYGGVCTGYSGSSEIRFNASNMRIHLNNIDDATGSYIVTVFDSSGGNTPDQTVAATGIRITSERSKPGRYLLRDECSGQWYASQGTELDGVEVTISSLSWFTVDESDAINTAISAGTATFPGAGAGSGVQTLNFTAVAAEPNSIDGGGWYFTTSKQDHITGLSWIGDPSPGCGMFVSAGPDLSVNINTQNPFIIDASSSSTDSLAWSIVSAPPGSTMTTANFLPSASVEDPNVTVDIVGTYEFMLTGSAAGQDDATDTVVITVADNFAPTVTVDTADTLILITETLTLDATSDDQDVYPGTMTYTWTAATGDGDVGSVTFGNAAAEDTTVDITTPGTYTLTLTVNDGQLDAIDSVVVTVIGNTAPTAVADVNDIVVLADGGTAALNGAGSYDDGLPGDPLVYTWSDVTVDGPAAVVITQDTSDPSGVATFTAAGVYTLNLNVSDTELSDDATVQVRVFMRPLITTTVACTADTFVRSDKGDRNHGINLKLAIAAGTDSDDPNTYYYGYLRFDPNSIAGAIKDFGSIMLTTSNNKSKDLNVTAWAATYTVASTRWVEGEQESSDSTAGGINWNTKDEQVTMGDQVGTAVGPGSNEEYAIDVAGIVFESDGTANFVIQSEIGIKNPNLYSRENIDYAPRLVISYDPNEAYNRYPGRNATEVHPKSADFIWTPGAGDTSAVVRVKEVGGSWITSGSIAVTAGVETSMPIADFIAELALGTDYQWQIFGNGTIESEIFTFTSMLIDPAYPINVSPADGAIDQGDPAFTFIPGEGVSGPGAQQDLYIDTDADVSDGRVVANVSSGVKIYALVPNTTYYWAINAEGKTSAATSFTTAETVVFDDFEGGVWPGGVAETVIVADESTQSMAIAYDDSDGADAATLMLAGGVDLSSANAAFLHIQYHGAIGNDAELMTVTLDSGAGGVVTVAYDGDPANIVEESYPNFHNWYVDLAGFAGVDMTSVESISIGVGDGAGTEAGTIYVDDITLNAPMCVRAKISGDFNGTDCMGDFNELVLLIRDWLLQAEARTAGGDVTSDLLMHFDFETLVADPGGDYYNSTVGGVTASVQGTVGVAAGPTGLGNAIDCAAGFVTVDDHATVLANITDGGTMAFWARTDTTVDPLTGKFVINDDNMFVSADGGSADNWRFRFNDTGTYRSKVLSGESVSTGYDGDDDISKVIGVWNHIACVVAHSDGYSAIYVNGELMAVSANVVPLTFGAPNGGDFNIGNRRIESLNPNKIDDFRIYNRVLTQEEVMTLAGTAPFVQPVVSAADTDNDGTVNLTDFANVVSIWLDTVVWP